MRIIKDDGSIIVSQYKDDQMHGYYRRIDPEGNYETGYHRKGVQEGLWSKYKKNGKLDLQVRYDENGNIA